jgi:hypothetical protein
MAKAEATVEELITKIERGELRLPEMQRRSVWRAPRVRHLLDSLYRGYPSGAILLWGTDEAAPAGLSISRLGITEFDPGYGGRWNAGSNRESTDYADGFADHVDYARQVRRRLRLAGFTNESA